MKKKIVFFVCALMLLANVIKAESLLLTVSYEPAKNIEQEHIKQLILSKNGIKPVIKLINGLFKPTKDRKIKLVFSNNDSGPYTELDSLSIFFPYNFLSEVKSQFEAVDYAKNSELGIDDFTIDTTSYVLLHELAHALIELYDLPIAGKEEDAADNLATFMLSEYVDNGQEVAISAADSFELWHKENNEYSESKYWDEHSLDLQRFYSIMCHVYGSAPDKYPDLLNKLDIDADRQSLCIDEYEKLSNSWYTLLKPWLKPLAIE